MQKGIVEIVSDDALKLQIDETLHETKVHGTEEFPFQCYRMHFDWNKWKETEWHWHEELELLMIESGGMKCSIGENSLSFHEGDCILINSRTVHRFEVPDEKDIAQCNCFSILFSSEIIAANRTIIYKKYVIPVLESGADYIVFHPEVVWQKHVLEMVDGIYEICRMGSSMIEMQIHMEMCSIWMELIEHLDEYRQEQKENQNMVMQARLRKMMQFISDHYAEQITLADIAQAANISQSAAQRCFRAGVQTSPISYLKDYRLTKAKEKLLSTHLTVFEIARSVGFDNAGYFDRSFKRAFGMTPKQFIRQESEKGTSD